jgi:sugar transferase EpsL
VRSQAIKRVVDIVGASVGIILFAPVMLVVALLVLLTMGRPVLFRQQRPGLRGKPFTLYKFRTMRDARTALG